MKRTFLFSLYHDNFLTFHHPFDINILTERQMVTDWLPSDLESHPPPKLQRLSLPSLFFVSLPQAKKEKIKKF
jgi:hypothetical protein